MSKKIFFVLIFFTSNLLASDVVKQRQESMQNFNKLMRSATQFLKSGDIQSLNDIYGEIQLEDIREDDDSIRYLSDKKENKKVESIIHMNP